MTVRQLIDRLDGFPDTEEVKILNVEFLEYVDIQNVYPVPSVGVIIT